MPAGRARGFTLLEVLVAVVVVSVGMLGILGLQTASLLNAQVSSARSAATVAVDNFAARMRANPGGDYDGIASLTDFASATDTPSCSGDAACSVAEMTAQAVYQWSRTLARGLPNGRGFVDCVDDGQCDAYRITVVWDEHDPQGGSAAGTDLCSDDPPGRAITSRCFVTVLRP